MAVLKEIPKRRLLRTWKEIAACLGVTVRSVERWEKQAGLPVYRQGGGRKARVYAYSDELQQWLDKGGLALREAGDAAATRPTTFGPLAQPVRRGSGRGRLGGLLADGCLAGPCASQLEPRRWISTD